MPLNVSWEDFSVETALRFFSFCMAVVCILCGIAWAFWIAPDCASDYIRKDEMKKFKVAIFAGGVDRVTSEVTHAGQTPLHSAVIYNKMPFIELLVNKKANVNAKVVTTGDTPLHIAARDNKQDVLEYLIKHGANLDELNQKQLSPLQTAILSNCEATALSLINAGARCSIKTESGETCLHFAAKTGNLALVKALLAKHLSPNSPDANKWTPLLHACAEGHEEVVKCLVDSGADLKYRFSFRMFDRRTTVTNDVEVSPLELANKAKKASLVTFLRTHNAR